MLDATPHADAGASRATPRTDAEVVSAYREIIARHGLSYSRASTLVGVSPQTTRYVEITGELPKRGNARDRFHAFVRANINATSISDLRIVA